MSTPTRTPPTTLRPWQVAALSAMEDWRGGPELALMQRIKAAVDPLGLMNPGKVLP